MYSPWSRPEVARPPKARRPNALARTSRVLGWLAVAGLLAALAGCATGPTVKPVPGYAAAWLGQAPRVLVRIDAAKVTAWGAVTHSRDSLRAVGDRTRAVWLGFDLDKLGDLHTAADTVHIVLEGDFPKGIAGFMLDINGAWKRAASPGVWTNPKLDLSVSLPQDGLVVAQRHNTQVPVPTAGVLRDLDPATIERSAVWVSFWNPGQALFGEPGARLLPFERVDVVLTAQGDELEGPVILRFSDDRAARAALVLLKLFSPQIRSRLGQDLDWTAEGSQIVGQTLRLKQNDLKTLAEKLVADPVPPEATP